MKAWARAGRALAAPPPGGLPSGRRGSGKWAPRPHPPRAAPRRAHSPRHKRRPRRRRGCPPASTRAAAAPARRAALPAPVGSPEAHPCPGRAHTDARRRQRARRDGVTAAPGAGESAVGEWEGGRARSAAVSGSARGVRRHQAREPVFRFFTSRFERF